MQLPVHICLPTYIIIAVPVAAIVLATVVGLIVRKVYLPKAKGTPAHVRHPKRNSKEPLVKEGEKPNGYDVFKSTNNYLATVGPVPVASPPIPVESDGYVVDVENLTQEIQSKEKEIERLSAEKEEFSVFLIRDLLASQKLTEELKKEVEFLRQQLTEADAKHPNTAPRYPKCIVTKHIDLTTLTSKKSMESEEVLKLQQTVQELTAKVRALEMQLRARSHSPTNTQQPLNASQARGNAFKPVDPVRPSPIPLSTPSSPSAIGIPMLEIFAEENAIEAKKREMEITKEFTHREAVTPRETVSPRDTSALKWRMEKGNKLDAFDKEGYLLIHRAILEDRWDVVKHLMQIGADLNSFDARGDTALHLAVRNENELMVDYLYEADPNASGNRDRSTPLHLCAYHGFTKCAAALLKAGADLEAKTEDGYTPLRVAIDRDQVDFAIWLIEKNNANINCIDDLGETLLTYAVRINKPSLIDFLLDGGAAPDMVDDRNLSPCIVAARADNIHQRLLLVSRGAAVDATNSDGRTALHFAATCGSTSAAQTLIELGANVDARDENGNTPLHDSCKNGKFSVSARLVANKADLNIQGGDGLTPLSLATVCNDDDTIALLMSNGAN